MKGQILIVAVVAGLAMTSCKKANLTRDQWTISQATDLEDGTDITSDYAGEVWEYSKDGNYIENNTTKGTWAWGDGKEKLIITENDGTVDTYTVKVLKKDEMELELPAEENIKLSRVQ